MPRPRRPPYLAKRGNRWYVFWLNPEKRRTERKSMRTSVESVARQRAIPLLGEEAAPLKAPTLVDRRKFISKLFNRAKTNAKERGQIFALSRAAIDEMLEVQSYRCAVTGVEFTFNDTPKDPWQPSIDRIDSGRGYHLDNVRLVCLIANLAMNRWGEDTLRALARQMVANAKTMPLVLE
jgi:hypothetical protein